MADALRAAEFRTLCIGLNHFSSIRNVRAGVYKSREVCKPQKCAYARLRRGPARFFSTSERALRAVRRA